MLGGPGTLRTVFQLRVRNYVPIAVMTLNSVLWGAVVVFVNRSYSSPSENQRPQPTPSLAPPGLGSRSGAGLKSA